MSRQIVPRPTQSSSPSVDAPQPSQRARKISTACGACKQRKTRVCCSARLREENLTIVRQCSGGTPCEACAARSSSCVYDVTSDQRRKVANQRNVQDLAEAQQDLERYRQLLGGIIATIRVGDNRSNEDLVTLIRSGVDLSQLAAHLRNECRSNPEIQEAYEAIDLNIDGQDNLPSPTQILSGGGQGPGVEGSSTNIEQVSGSIPTGLDVRMFSPEPSQRH